MKHSWSDNPIDHYIGNRGHLIGVLTDALEDLKYHHDPKALNTLMEVSPLVSKMQLWWTYSPSANPNPFQTKDNP